MIATFLALIAKDLRRTWRNPGPWMINLIIPIGVTAFIGFLFGGQSDHASLARIRCAIVDEDQTLLSGFVFTSASRLQGGKLLDPALMSREDALHALNANKVSAAIIIPPEFTRHYLTGQANLGLELIKNPAESIGPAVLEELSAVVVTALNLASRNFRAELAELQVLMDGKNEMGKVSGLVQHLGGKMTTAKDYLSPMLIDYEKETRIGNVDVKSGGLNNSSSSPRPTGAPTNLFAFLLIGMSTMFLFFLGNSSMSDLNREIRQHTFKRYLLLHASPLLFVTAKAAYTVVTLLLCTAIMWVGGGLFFRIHWHHPLALSALVFSYSFFVAALLALLVALVTNERQSGALNTIVAMTLGMIGGCTFAANQLPTLLRDHVTPYMPSYWFIEVVRNLQEGGANVAWGVVAFKLIGLSLLLIAGALLLFGRRFREGTPA